MLHIVHRQPQARNCFFNNIALRRNRARHSAPASGTRPCQREAKADFSRDARLCRRSLDESPPDTHPGTSCGCRPTTSCKGRVRSDGRATAPMAAMLLDDMRGVPRGSAGTACRARFLPHRRRRYRVQRQVSAAEAARMWDWQLVSAALVVAAQQGHPQQLGIGA